MSIVNYCEYATFSATFSAKNYAGYTVVGDDFALCSASPVYWLKACVLCVEIVFGAHANLLKSMPEYYGISCCYS